MYGARRIAYFVFRAAKLALKRVFVLRTPCVNIMTTYIGRGLVGQSFKKQNKIYVLIIAIRLAIDDVVDINKQTTLTRTWCVCSKVIMLLFI